jgi:hypothetical protein
MADIIQKMKDRIVIPCKEPFAEMNIGKEWLEDI